MPEESALTSKGHIVAAEGRRRALAIHATSGIIAGMIQKLGELLEAHPFRAFTVALADGRRFDIPSPDMVWMPAEGRGGLHFFLPAEDRIVSVNLMLVVSVEWAAGGHPA